MKIGIITYHFPYNCGAVLQCAALQSALEAEGHEVCVINYRPWYHQNRYTAFKRPIVFVKCALRRLPENAGMKTKIKTAFSSLIRVVGSWRHYFARKPQDNKFQNFIKKHLHTTRVYRTLKQLQKDPPDCDLYISGSDQLWNVHITEKRFDEAYFLKFGSPKTGRITFSVGADFTECDDPEAQLVELLKGLDAVALREGKCVETIRKCAPNLPVTITVDPTFLIQKEAYDKFMTTACLEKEPFIFTYTMTDSTQAKVYNAAKLLSEKTGLKVIDACGQPTKANKKVADNRICGPDEFLWYMKNASYVLTNSFHGTAFSIIMEKQFCSIPHSKTGYRVMEILEKTGLEDRWTKTGMDAVKVITEKIPYDEKKEQRDALVAGSLNYLQECAAKYGKQA